MASTPKPWERGAQAVGLAQAAAAAGVSSSSSSSATPTPTSVSTPAATAATGTPTGSGLLHQRAGLYGATSGTYGSPYSACSNLAAGGYGGYGAYGGGYGGYGGGYGGFGNYGGYGSMGRGFLFGGPFGGMHGDTEKDQMPPGLRHLETVLFSIGRITQMLEMNFEVLQHFLGSVTALVERMRTMYNDARTLSTTVGRQSLEFGQSSLTTVREARLRVRRHPLASLTIISLCLTLLFRLLRLRVSRRRLTNRSLGEAFASSALSAAW
jgi:hypothetical protein